MNLKNRTVLAVACFALLTACARDPIEVTRSDNAEINVEKMFTHDGCTIYRFLDTRYHYYAACKDARATVSEGYVTHCGKGCTRTDYDDAPTATR